VVDNPAGNLHCNKHGANLVSQLDRLKSQLQELELHAVNLRLASIYIERLDEVETARVRLGMLNRARCLKSFPGWKRFSGTASSLICIWQFLKSSQPSLTMLQLGRAHFRMA
jgi:hypothetical protein